MRKLFAILAIAAMFAVNSACADIILYGSEDPAKVGIKMGAWGSGYAVKDTKHALLGSNAIKVHSQSLYAGGRMDFTKPVTVPAAKEKDSRYLTFSLFFANTKQVNPAAGTVYAYEVEPYTISVASRIRFLFISADGKCVDYTADPQPVDPDDNWMKVSVPLAKFAGMGDFRLARLIMFCDEPNGDFFIGAITLTDDKEPIIVEPLDSQVIAVMDELFFVARAQAGCSNLDYSWDFDSSDGITRDASGTVARKFFTKGGNYTVTLTVTDKNKIKDPVKVTTVIEVNE
ncbi:MAG: PKD domain-containing protein [Abditibacteriota bacterium]|nr:PKD domain-containing protein [Abditibacteriota bacterium]